MLTIVDFKRILLSILTDATILSIDKEFVFVVKWTLKKFVFVKAEAIKEWRKTRFKREKN